MERNFKDKRPDAQPSPLASLWATHLPSDEQQAWIKTPTKRLFKDRADPFTRQRYRAEDEEEKQAPRQPLTSNQWPQPQTHFTTQPPSQPGCPHDDALSPDPLKVLDPAALRIYHRALSGVLPNSLLLGPKVLDGLLAIFMNENHVFTPLLGTTRPRALINSQARLRHLRCLPTELPRLLWAVSFETGAGCDRRTIPARLSTVANFQARDFHRLVLVFSPTSKLARARILSSWHTAVELGPEEGKQPPPYYILPQL
jgi:hypothetical protein